MASVSFVLGFVGKEIDLLSQPIDGCSVTTRVETSLESELLVPLPSIAVRTSFIGRFFPAVAEWSLAFVPFDGIASQRSATDTRLEIGASRRGRRRT